jgi:PAS domain-containing protein
MAQHVEMILMRQLASYLRLPIFVADAEGELVFYNEAAEALLGRRFDEVGGVPLGAITSRFEVTAEDGRPLAPDEIPLGIALRQRRPNHATLLFRSLDGIGHRTEVTAFPLESQDGRLVGAVALFWEAGG